MSTPEPITGRCFRCKQAKPLFEAPDWWATTYTHFCSPCWQAEATAADQPGWDACCETCNDTAGEYGWEEGEMTRAEAARWKRDHQCRPDVELVAPKRNAAEAAKSERFAPGVQTLELTR